jgi:hypothetical protein
VAHQGIETVVQEAPDVTFPATGDKPTSQNLVAEQKSVTAFMKQHGSGLAQLHGRILYPSSKRSAFQLSPVLPSPPSCSETVTDLVTMLTKRYPDMDPDAINEEVRKALGCSVHWGESVCIPSTSETSPEPGS